MVYAVCYDDEIRIWWNGRKEFRSGYFYKLTLNERNCFFTKEVYYDFKNLQAGERYSFTIEVVDDKKRLVGEAERAIYETLPYKARLDVTQAPYFAIGDGITDNTSIIQRVFDECTKDEYVYFPIGEYVCGAVKMRGDVKIRFDAGASLRREILEKETQKR